MPRLAWFSPLPPVTSGIAKYTAELLPTIADAHDVDLFVDGSPAKFTSPDTRVRVFSAHDFVWKHRLAPYDLPVYQLGNASCHDYMWAYMFRYSGLVVLHDGQLHHARARMLLQQWRPRVDDYRTEFRFNHPDANVDVIELGREGALGSLTYLWPMLRTVVESSRLMVVHNAWLADQIREAHPAASVAIVEMGVPAPMVRADARASVRARYNIPVDAVLFIAFGKVTPEKRIAEAIRAMAAMSHAVSNVHLLLAGETVEYCHPEVQARGLGIDNKVTVAGFVADEEIDDYLSAADVCLCMRWPTSRETSASWLRCLAAGRPTITTDLVHTADIPTLDPRNWSVLEAAPDMPVADLKVGTTRETETKRTAEPVGVSIDILDEDHSLKLAMRRLATDAPLRTRLGNNARQLWLRRFQLDRMADGYREVIETALASPLPDASIRAHLPAHFVEHGTEHAERVLREAGLADALRSDLWIGRAE
jgi:glycosyltransferase involved in cell wall biosynthesis